MSISGHSQSNAWTPIYVLATTVRTINALLANNSSSFACFVLACHMDAFAYCRFGIVQLKDETVALITAQSLKRAHTMIYSGSALTLARLRCASNRGQHLLPYQATEWLDQHPVSAKASSCCDIRAQYSSLGAQLRNAIRS
jgi:hypothetical protein